LFPNAAPEPVQPTIETGDTPSLTVGDVSVLIKQNPYAFTFNSPKGVITTSHPKSQYVVDVPYRWTVQSASASSCLATDVSANPSRHPEPSSLRYMVQELNISPGERFYGFGEQFGPFVKNGRSIIDHSNLVLLMKPHFLIDGPGQQISMWNQDGGTASMQAYKCIPFYFSTAGYGLFVNHPGEVEFEVGSEKVSRITISVQGASLEYFFIYGTTPLEVRF
jgi:alpha-glucosidase (family GH31 glycosyl hydrolase)